MPSLEDTQAQLNYELAVYREQMSMIKRETERVSLTTIDLNNALRTVEKLRVEEMLVPIGGGALIRGKASGTTVLVPIGGEYVVEMERELAEDELRRRIEATKKAVEKLTEEFNKIVSKLREVSSQLQQLQTQTALNRQVDSNIREDYI